MKVSELNRQYMTDYLRLDEPNDIELKEIDTALNAAIAYAKSYTGLDENEMEEHEDITIAVLILAADMYENRNVYLDYKNKEVNRAVTTILGMYQVNLL